MLNLLAHDSADPFHIHPHGAESSGSFLPYVLGVLGALATIALLRVVLSRSRP